MQKGLKHDKDQAGIPSYKARPIGRYQMIDANFIRMFNLEGFPSIMGALSGFFTS